jgi:hypothetical protein
MKISLDHSLHYEIVAQLKPEGPIERFQARHASCGSPVILHRFPLGDVDLEAVQRDIQRFAQIRDPRLPLLTDAWVSNGSFEFAWIAHDKWELQAREARVELEQLPRGYIHQVATQTLSALRVLHENSLAHQGFEAPCFTVLPGGLVFLKRPGMLVRLLSSLENDGRFGGGFQLASNLYSQDVAQWACLVATVAGGIDILTAEERDVTGVTMATIERARGAIRSNVADRALQVLLNTALDAWEPDGRGFENAAQAWDELCKSFPGEET